MTPTEANTKADELCKRAKETKSWRHRIRALEARTEALKAEVNEKKAHDVPRT